MVDDVNANIGVNIDTSSAIASLKNLQREISLFHTQMARGGATANAQAAQLQSSLLNAVNATGQFQASMTRVNSTTEAFTTALEKNKLTMGQYFRYAGGASKTFGRMFKSEFDTISKVAVERVKDLQTQYISMGRDANGALQSIKIRPLALDMDNLATRTMVAAQKQQLFNQLLTQGSTNLLNFGKNTQWAGRQLMVGFTIPLTLFATSAAKSFMEIEKQVIKIRRVYGDFSTTVKETDDMVTSIKALAGEYTKYGIAVSDTIGLASEAAAAGKTGQELLAQVSEATRLAVLGNVEQSQALETTMSITNAFGTATEQLASKIDFLNAVENQSVTSIEDLTEAIPKAGPVVQQLGGDVEDLAFFLTAMKEGGINASEGANALKSGLAALINPTGKAKEMLQGFGINIEKIVESNKGDIKGLVIDFASALDTLDPLNRARAIEQLFGKFQFSRLSTLFQNVIGEGTQASRVLELTKATTQELAILSQRELKKVEDTTTYKFEKAFADFQAALAPVGEQFLKVVTPILEFGTKLLTQFNSMGDGAKNFTVILTTVVAGIGPVLLMTVGLVANGVANLIKMFQLLGGIFRKTGADTGILGTQTDYMTQQQIEAAAVAASLNQSHSKLTQTFSVEAAALNSLTAAYQKAITAQRGFGGGASVPGSSTKPKKYANGVVSVPGPKGKGDVVPAMLSPGEAVIPAGMAKKYGGLIEGMIAGNLPGYEGGLDPNANVKGLFNATLFQPESMNTSMGRIGSKGIPTADAAAYLKQAGGAAAGSLMATMARSMGVKLNDPTLKAEFDALGKTLITNATTALENSGRQFVNDDDFDEIVTPALKNSARGISVAGQEVSTALNKAITEIRTVSKIGIGGGTSGGAGRLSLPGSYRADRLAGQQYAIATNPEMFRTATIPSKTQIKGERKSFQTLNPSTQKWETGTAAHIRRSVNMSVQKLMATVSPYLGDISGRLIKYLGDGVTKGMRDSTKTASPSKVTTQIGADIGQGAINGLNSKVDDAANAGAELGQATVDGTQIAKGRANRRVTKATDGQIIVSQPGTQIIPGATRRGPRRSQRAMGSPGEFKNQPATYSPNIMYGPQPKKPGIGSRIASGVRGGLGRMGGMGTMGAGMAASMGGMALSSIPGMESVGGAVSGAGGIISVLGMFGPMLAKIPIPILAIGAAVTGLVAAAVIAEQKMKEVRKAAADMAIAMGSGQKVMQGFAETAGSVSPSELMSKQRQESLVPLKAITDETIAFGQGYLESEAGKALIDGFKKTAKESSNSAAVQSLGNQLSTAVISGILSDEQADSIALAIATSLNNQSIMLDVTAQIQSVSVSGDLTTDRGLEAGSNLIEDSAKSASSTLTSLFAKTQKVTGIFDSSWGSIAESEGKFAGELISMLGQEQLMVDALDVQYQKRIENLKLQGKEQEAVQLTAEWETKRGQLIDENAKRNKELLNVVTEMTRGASRTAVGGTQATYASQQSAKAIKNQVVQSAKDVFAGTDQESTANTLLDKISSGKMDTTASVMISASIAAGSMPLDTLDKFVNMFDPSKAGNTETYNFAANILTNYGAEGSTIIDIANMFEDEEKATTFIAQFNAMNLEDGKEAVSVLSDLTKFSGIVNIEALASFITSGSDKAQDFIDSMGELETLSASGKLNYESIIEQNIITDPAAEAAFTANQEYFNNLPDVQKKLYVQAFLSVVATVSDEDVAQLRKEAGAFGSYFAGAEGKNRAIAAIAAQRAKAIVQAQNAFNSMMGSAEDGGGGDGAGGGGGGGTPEDAEIKRLNDLKDKQQKALNVIALKEDAINKVYDKRKKALEEIAKLNQKIAENQKSQLTIAEALSSGDISAAARAVQEARAKAAQYAEDQQMQALEKKRQMELDGIIVNGKTKEAYEAEIAKLNLQIAERELAIANGAAISGGGAGGSGGGSGSGSGAGSGDGLPPAPTTLPPRPTADAGYGKFWKPVGNSWVKADKPKPGTPLPPGKIWVWNNTNDSWYQTLAPGTTGGGSVAVASGGLIGYSMGGRVANRYMASGGSIGSDTISAMLTPGEFVVKRPAVQSFGVKNLEAINSGKSANGSVYNYSVTVNASTGANADEIARTVISRIKQVDGQKLRGNRY